MGAWWFIISIMKFCQGHRTCNPEINATSVLSSTTRWSPWWWSPWSMKREVMYFSFMWPWGSHSNCLLFNWLIRCVHVTLTLKRGNFFSTSVPEITLIKRNEYSIIALRQGTVCRSRRLSVSKSFVSESASHSHWSVNCVPRNPTYYHSQSASLIGLIVFKSFVSESVSHSHWSVSCVPRNPTYYHCQSASHSVRQSLSHSVRESVSKSLVIQSLSHSVR